MNHKGNYEVTYHTIIALAQRHSGWIHSEASHRSPLSRVTARIPSDCLSVQHLNFRNNTPSLSIRRTIEGKISECQTFDITISFYLHSPMFNSMIILDCESKLASSKTYFRPKVAWTHEFTASQCDCPEFPIECKCQCFAHRSRLSARPHRPSVGD
jgi:hypothetical protein